METDSHLSSSDAPERIEISRVIKAPKNRIFTLLCDPKGHVQIDSTGMLISGSGKPAGKSGDTFTIHMDRESLNDYPLGKYDVIVKIETFAKDKEISWTIHGAITPPIGHVYGYRLDDAEDGTQVTSYYDWSNITQTWRDANIFPVISELAIRATLGILARTVEDHSQ